MKTVNVYFIRHCNDLKHDKGNPYRAQELFQEGRIAIFYENWKWGDIYDENEMKLRGSKFKGYQKYKTAAQYFADMVHNGGYVFAEYASGDMRESNDKNFGEKCSQKGCLLGKISKGGKVEPFICDGRSIANATIKLEDTVRVDYASYPVLLAARPPYVTICQPSGGAYQAIAEIKLEGKKVEDILQNADSLLMHHKVVEQMCHEYLRIHGVDGNEETKLKYCFLNLGGNLSTIDIAGRLNNKKILYAQVKNAPCERNSGVYTNMLSLRKKQDDAVLVVFCKPDRSGNDVNCFEKERRGVLRINVDDVFKYFFENSGTRQMIIDMIGIKDVREFAELKCA